MYRIDQGDCLELMDSIEPGSVGLVLIDPPYGIMGKIKNLPNFSAPWDEALEPAWLLEAFARVLQVKRKALVFSMEPFTSKITMSATGMRNPGRENEMIFNYRLAWVKSTFGNPLSAKKAPMSYFEDICVFSKLYDRKGQKELRSYAQRLFEFIGKSQKAIDADLGHMGAVHFLGYDGLQFSRPSKKTYSELADAYGLRELGWFKEYSWIADEFSKTGSAVFNLAPGTMHKSNVLCYPKDLCTGEHPTQKPVALLEDLINTYPNPGDTVLDFVMGSGSTGVACANTGRRFIGFELDAGYFETAKKRISAAYENAKSTPS